jgi:hypothetical protein
VVHREPTFLQLHEPLRTTLIHLYKIPEKRQGGHAFYRRVVAKIYCYSGSSYGRLQTYCKQYKLKFKTYPSSYPATSASSGTSSLESSARPTAALSAK